ncbi:MAG: glycine--tRNA ligase subunit beta, partial [Pseudomonadota bacterium]
PTGAADPYALRRQCLGIINILLNKKYNLSLPELVSKAVVLLEDKKTRPREEICSDVLNYFSGRLSNLLTSQGYSYDVVDAVLAPGLDNITDRASRVEALQQMKKDPDFESLAVSFKRVVNILRAADPSQGVDPAAFEHEAEKKLYQKYLAMRDRVTELMAQRMYVQALQMISTIREPVDNFFDNVLVMADDMKVRQNRVALLHEVNSLFTGFADFSKIAAE